MNWLKENSGWMIWTAVIISGAWFFLGDDSNQVKDQPANVYGATRPTTAPVSKTSTSKPSKQTEQKCHTSYSGCLNPNASDYDCAGGSGNGPYYTGKVRVIGPDVFGLDRDNDGWGCE